MQTARTGQEGDDGFTLIELLVVIVILGVLATIAIPTFLGQRERAYNAAAKSDSRSISKLITAYEADGLSPHEVTFEDLEANGFTASPNVQHAICGMADLSFAVASHHLDSLTVWLVDLDGRLVESSEATAIDAVEAIVGGACDNPVVSD